MFGPVNPRAPVEPRVLRWRRRLLTIGGYVLGFMALLALLPVLLPVALATDLLRDRRLPTTRLLLFAVAYLGCETIGLCACLFLLLAPSGQHGRRQRWHYALQSLWARTLFAAAGRLFSFRVEVEGDGSFGRGPLIVFARHASLADTLLPAVLLAHRHRLRLRYVLKRELLWDPCLDVVGQRLPNVFVRRGSGDGASEIAVISMLAADLGVDEGILIYPEGTRFSALKQLRAQEAIARSDPGRAARVARLRHVLPPRTGGPLALLDAQPAADALFLAHVGLEGTASLTDVLRGNLIGRLVRVGFWRVRGADIPRTREAKVAWLDAQWTRMDEWVAAGLASSEDSWRSSV